MGTWVAELKRNQNTAYPPRTTLVSLSTEFNTKGISYSYLEPWLGKGLLTASGERWRTHRKFLTPAFHFNILQNFLPVFCKNTKVLVEKLDRAADGKTPIDLFPIIALAALDNVTESIMGVCVNAQKDSESPYVKAIEDLSNLTSARMRNPVIGEDAIFNLLPHKRRQDRALKILHGQSMKVIEARREELKMLNLNKLDYNSEFGIKNKHAFLDLLLLAEIDGKKIDGTRVREEVDTFMFEGHDTTTSGIVFALFCISKNNDVQEKILEEQRAIFADDFERDPTYSELSHMKYLECVIKESLRLYPSVPFIERRVPKDIDIAGLHLPKDASVIFNFYHMQRRPEVFDEPLVFRPERFAEAKESKHAFSWLAFSAGPRNCIGQKFAMMELKVVLSAVIRQFKVLPYDQEPILCADLILRSENGVHVRLERRK
ncbi:cytochrome p450 domain-containing protein [Phthorimaea operculella]|nr:cytochrome p450 domain-containing protein [Phthorimaea operculella]